MQLQNNLREITFIGLRAAIGVIFIVHGYGKLGNEGFVGWMSSMGIGPEIAMLIAFAEIIPGTLLIVGVLSRISCTILSVIMLGAIFYIKGAAELAGDNGYEFDLILLAAILVVIVSGPGKISLAFVIKKLPGYLH